MKLVPHKFSPLYRNPAIPPRQAPVAYDGTGKDYLKGKHLSPMTAREKTAKYVNAS